LLTPHLAVGQVSYRSRVGRPGCPGVFCHTPGEFCCYVPVTPGGTCGGCFFCPGGGSLPGGGRRGSDRHPQACMLRRGPAAAPGRIGGWRAHASPRGRRSLRVMAARERLVSDFEALSGAPGLAGALPGFSVAPWISLSGRWWPGRPAPGIWQPAGQKLF